MRRNHNLPRRVVLQRTARKLRSWRKAKATRREALWMALAEKRGRRRVDAFVEALRGGKR